MESTITTDGAHGFTVGDRLKIHITVEAVIRGFHRAMTAPRKDYKWLCRQAVDKYHRLYGRVTITQITETEITVETSR